MKDHLGEIAVESTNVSQDLEAIASLLGTLSETFGSATNLYRKLRRKIHKSEQYDGSLHTKSSRRRRDSSSDSDALHKALLRQRGRTSSTTRKRDDVSDSDEEVIAEDSAVVHAEYQHGYDRFGEQFAVGDLLAQNQLQTQIIRLQQTIIRLHQHEETDLSSSDLRHLLQTTRSTRTAAKDALIALYQRLRRDHEHPRISGAFPHPALNPQCHETVVHHSSRRARSTSRSRSQRTDISNTTTPPPPTTLFCPYALDLQRNPTQPLASAFHHGGDARCPYCRHQLSISSSSSVSTSRAWEVVFDDENPFARRRARTFIFGSRFVVKCHREGGGFACVLCCRWRNADTVCWEVAELIDHVWREHGVGDVLGDGDVWEVG
ncbi:hypothetical protein K491DRAFT_494692 [Lophiostoma macrostomum CBS 122681]|uniref:Uncharacterized protein n=1 Tax=Lophiostoma macrostomum CBS 122681 TaxID=1314788 RepID=A0A6A6T2F4_9PLEO|nr:hypothetical protein K491DRAFT_494692 [Lophiostoma macrostomum CBS 122681]